MRQKDLNSKYPIPIGISYWIAIIEQIQKYRNGENLTATFTLSSKKFKDGTRKNYLQITKVDDRYLEVLQQAKNVIINDATATPEDIAAFCTLIGNRQYVMLNQQVESSPAERNLDIEYFQTTQWTEYLGNHGRHKNTQNHLHRLIQDCCIYLKIDPKRAAALDYKKYQNEYDYLGVTLTHFSTGRGSNLAQDVDALFIIGDPKQNRSSLQEEYLLKYCSNPQEYDEQAFQDFVFQAETKEIMQEIHRARINRQSNKKLRIIFITQRTTTWLDEPVHPILTPWLADMPQPDTNEDEVLENLNHETKLDLEKLLLECKIDEAKYVDEGVDCYSERKGVAEVIRILESYIHAVDYYLDPARKKNVGQIYKLVNTSVGLTQLRDTIYEVEKYFARPFHFPFSPDPKL